MIAVFGGLADVERDLIRTRTAEGRSRAQKRGQHMGRPSKLTDARRPKHGGGGRRARPLRNSRAATHRQEHDFKTDGRSNLTVHGPVSEVGTYPLLGENDRGSDPAIRAARNHRDRASARNKRRGKDSEYYKHAEATTSLISFFAKSVPQTLPIFARFWSQTKKHHLLALLSTVRLHQSQAMMDLRLTLEAAVCAAFAIVHT